VTVVLTGVFLIMFAVKVKQLVLVESYSLSMQKLPVSPFSEKTINMASHNFMFGVYFDSLDQEALKFIRIYAYQDTYKKGDHTETEIPMVTCQDLIEKR